MAAVPTSSIPDLDDTLNGRDPYNPLNIFNVGHLVAVVTGGGTGGLSVF